MHLAYTDHYNLFLILLAFFIIWLASYTALNLSNRIAASRAWQQKLWIAYSALTLGTGAWSMNMIANLAGFHLTRLTFHMQSVLTSLAFVIIGSLIGFFITYLTGPGLHRFLVGGTFMGLSVASMNYMGLSAFHAVEIDYLPIPYILSVLLAIGSSLLALKLSAASNQRLLFSGLLISLAFTVVHYSGFFSVAVTWPASGMEGLEDASQVSTFVLAMLFALGTIIFLLVSLIGSFQIDQKLAQQSALKASLLDTSIDSILMFNSRGWIIEFNPAAAEAFGYTRKQALSLTLLDFLYPFDQNGESAASLFQQLVRQDAALLGKRMHMKAYRSDRSEFPAEITITRFPFAGKTVYAATVRDLTDMKDLRNLTEHKQGFAVTT